MNCYFIVIVGNRVTTILFRVRSSSLPPYLSFSLPFSSYFSLSLSLGVAREYLLLFLYQLQFGSFTLWSNIQWWVVYVCVCEYWFVLVCICLIEYLNVNTVYSIAHTYIRTDNTDHVLRYMCCACMSVCVCVRESEWVHVCGTN